MHKVRIMLIMIIKRALYIITIFVVLMVSHINVGGASVVYVADDGIDDHVEINKALDYVESIGGTIYMKSGTFVNSGPLNVASNTILTGSYCCLIKK